MDAHVNVLREFGDHSALGKADGAFIIAEKVEGSRGRIGCDVRRRRFWWRQTVRRTPASWTAEQTNGICIKWHEMLCLNELWS